MSRKIGVRPWIDFAFRKIFGKRGNEICLISLLDSVLELPVPIESIEFKNPFSMKDYESDKQVCVDVKATDQEGRIFVVEIQLVVNLSFAKRALFYACSAYADQLGKGQGYGELKATYCVCLLMRRLWDDRQLHHQFRLVERTSGRVLEESIEIHTVELSKYNGRGESVRSAGVLEQWCYWIKNADKHSEGELRALLPGLPFLQATAELRDIQAITEEKEMYNSREKAVLDYEANLIDAQREAREAREAIENAQAEAREAQAEAREAQADASIAKAEALEAIENANAEARIAREAIENANAEARIAREAVENANVEAREALKKGEAIGVEIGSIQLLQRLIGLSVQGQEELRVMPLEDLVTLRESLNTELQNRAS
ncbi:MAG: Rpn family recombination-promoting nuclease/putative transposase [Planctomycetota bacterium]